MSPRASKDGGFPRDGASIPATEPTPVGHTHSPATPPPAELEAAGDDAESPLRQVAAYLRRLVDADLPGLVSRSGQLFDLLRAGELQRETLHKLARELRDERDREVDKNTELLNRRAPWRDSLAWFVIGAGAGAIAAILLRW